jgi:hypothetical protein
LTHSIDYLIQASDREDSLYDGACLVPSPRVLGEVADRSAAQNLAARWHCFARKNLRESAFSRSISSHKSNSIAMIYSNCDSSYEKSSPRA